MSANAFIPQLWSVTIQRTIENKLVAKQICNTQFTGEIKKAGDTVHFPGLADPSVNTYAGTIVYEDLVSSDIPLLVDQKNYFAFQVSDIESAQSKVELQNSQAARAAYQLKDKCDEYILGLYANAGNTITNASVTSANVLSAIGSIAQKLDEANVPNEQKWIVIPPWVKLKLALAGIKFSIKEGTAANNGVEWTKDLGFSLYVSNNINTTSGVSSILGGSNNAIAFADQITETRAMDLEDKFATGVSGLHVFGAKVIKPAELVCGAFTCADETTI